MPDAPSIGCSPPLPGRPGRPSLDALRLSTSSGPPACSGAIGARRRSGRFVAVICRPQATSHSTRFACPGPAASPLGRVEWLPGLDSNQNWMSQSHLCCHYTTGQWKRLTLRRTKTRSRTERKCGKEEERGTRKEKDAGLLGAAVRSFPRQDGSLQRRAVRRRGGRRIQGLRCGWRGFCEGLESEDLLVGPPCDLELQRQRNLPGTHAQSRNHWVGLD